MRTGALRTEGEGGQPVLTGVLGPRVRGNSDHKSGGTAGPPTAGHNNFIIRTWQNDRESVVLLKLLNTISVAPSNIELDMLSSKC